MTHFVKINGEMHKMESAKFTFRRAGRYIRRWHKFVTGIIGGILVTVCLSAAKILDVISAIGSAAVRRIEQQGMLCDARVLRTRAC